MCVTVCVFRLRRGKIKGGDCLSNSVYLYKMVINLRDEILFLGYYYLRRILHTLVNFGQVLCMCACSLMASQG